MLFCPVLSMDVHACAFAGGEGSRAASDDDVQENAIIMQAIRNCSLMFAICTFSLVWISGQYT
jgi:hypothetical protein